MLGFLAVDLASALGLRLFNPGRNLASVDYGDGAKLPAVGLLGPIRKIPRWWWRPMAART